MVATLWNEFQEAVQHARGYEKALDKYIRNRFGGRTLATYDYNGLGEDKPPKLYGEDQDLIVPDFLWFGQKTSRWIECKWKTGASPRPDRKSGEIVTGFNLRHWEHYNKVQKETGIEVVIIFIHQREAECLFSTLAELRDCEDHRWEKWGNFPNGAKRPPMIYFVCRKLKRLCSLKDLLRFYINENS